MISGGAAPSSAPVMICPQLKTSPLMSVVMMPTGKHQLVGRGGERERIEELRPAHREGKDRCGDHAGQRDRDEDLGQRLHPSRAIDQRRLVELLRDRGEVADHDPGANGHRQRRIDDQQHPPAVDELNAGPLVEHRKHLEQRQEQQRLGDQVGQKDAGGQASPNPRTSCVQARRQPAR